MVLAGAKLYTWLDVEDVFVRLQDDGVRWPQWLFGVRAYWDSLTLIVQSGSEDTARTWLHEVFDPRLEDADAEVSIALESVGGRNRSLPVILQSASDSLPGPRLAPTLARPGTIQSDSFSALQPPPLPPSAATIYVFHSFKGGVGRTMHAVALAAIAAKRGHKILLIDADFEAPGITWMLEHRLPTPPISFSDVLALAHGDESLDLSETIPLVVNRLQDAVLDGIYVLPAFRSVQRFATLSIRPEHLQQSHPDPFLLTDVLLKLAAGLDVQAVVVDLRAGLSELAAGLLLDPRLQRILVTTMSDQSLRGTSAVLDLLAKRAPSQREDHPLPIVITNQVPAEFDTNESLRRIEEALFEALARTTTSEVQSSEMIRGPSIFDASLMVLPASWDTAISLISRSTITRTLMPFVDDLPSPRVQEKMLPVEDKRSALEKTAADLVFAEKSGSTSFLATSPLRRLASDHKTQVPVTVVIGAKGAGKTYTYLQLMRRGTWARFSEDATGIAASVDAPLIPVLSAVNLGEQATQQVSKAKADLQPLFGTEAPLSEARLRDFIRDWLRQDLHEGEWRERWLDLIAWAAGFQVETTGAGRAFIQMLREHQRKCIAVIDGLEDVFQDLPTGSAEQFALRSLTQEVPNWLAQERERPLGIIIFVRRDMIFNAVKQNPAQLIAKYEPYDLRWDRIEALRLILWVCNEAHCLHEEKSLSLDLSEAELIDALVPVWGRKLGPDRSREGRSAEWVIAALSDFRGQIQARDVVRLLHLSAKHSAGGSQAWPDRILTPNGIRAAVADCSREKIAEILQENPRLGDVLTYLKGLPETKRSVPFSQQDLGLKQEQIALLEANGVVVAESGEYYMPEIFRRGLEFRLPQGARPKVLALARRRSA